MRRFVGTSGYSYPHWRGVFYPRDCPTREWLPFYSRHFAAVEINMTFYGLPKEEAFRHWAEVTPPGFRFVLKGSRYITHVRRLRDVEDSWSLLRERSRPLGDKLAAFLWQLPPRFPRDAVRLEAFCRILRGGRGGTAWDQVFEFRDPSWVHPETCEVLRRYRAVFCTADGGGVAFDEPTTDAVYLRFHGPEARYASCYSEEALREWADRFRGRRDIDRLYAFFNNDARGWAVRNAARFAELLGGQGD